MLKYHHSKPLKNLFGLLLLTTAASFAVAAPKIENQDTATDIKISNSTKSVLSFSIGNNCSKEIGVIHEHSVKVISRKYISHACEADLMHCSAKIYAVENCSGNPIASINIDVAGWGVMSIMTHSHSYHIGANGFNVFINGSWV